MLFILSNQSKIKIHFLENSDSQQAITSYKQSDLYVDAVNVFVLKLSSLLRITE